MGAVCVGEAAEVVWEVGWRQVGGCKWALGGGGRIYQHNREGHKCRMPILSLTHPAGLHGSLPAPAVHADVGSDRRAGGPLRQRLGLGWAISVAAAFVTHCFGRRNHGQPAPAPHACTADAPASRHGSACALQLASVGCPPHSHQCTLALAFCMSLRLAHALLNLNPLRSGLFLTLGSF